MNDVMERPMEHLMNVLAALALEHGSGRKHDGVECMSLHIPENVLCGIEEGQMHLEIERNDDGVYIHVVHDKKGRGYNWMMDTAQQIMND